MSDKKQTAELKTRSIRLSDETMNDFKELLDQMNVKNQDEALRDFMKMYELNTVIDMAKGESDRLSEFKDHLYRAVDLFADSIKAHEVQKELTQTSFREETSAYVDKIKTLDEKLKVSKEEIGDYHEIVKHQAKELEQLDTIKDLVQEYKLKLEAYEAKEATFNTAIEDNANLQQNVAELTIKLDAANGAIQTQITKNEALEGKIQVFDETTAQLEAQITSLSDEKQRLELEEAQLNNVITLKDGEIKNANTEAQLFKSQFETAHKDHRAELETERKENRLELEKERSEAKVLQEQLLNHRVNVQALERNIQEKDTEINKLREEKTLLEGQISEDE